MAVYFDGTNHILVGDHTSLDIDGGHDWAFAGWARSPNITDTSQPRIFAYGTPGGTPSIQVWYPGNGIGTTAARRHLSARVIDDAGSDSGWFYITAVDLGLTLDQKWFAWALTYDASATSIELWINVRSAGANYSNAVSVSLGAINPTGGLYIGNTPAGTQPWTGAMAHFAHYRSHLDGTLFHAFQTGGTPWMFGDCRMHLPLYEGKSDIGWNDETINGPGALTLTRGGTNALQNVSIGPPLADETGDEGVLAMTGWLDDPDAVTSDPAAAWRRRMQFLGAR